MCIIGSQLALNINKSVAENRKPEATSKGKAGRKKKTIF